MACGRCGGTGRTTPLEVCPECKGSRRRAVPLNPEAVELARDLNGRFDERGPLLLDKWDKYDGGGDGIFPPPAA